MVSVNSHESQLAQAILGTVRTPQARGRPIKVGTSYRQKWKIERRLAWMDNCRRLVWRYERSLVNYRCFLSVGNQLLARQLNFEIVCNYPQFLIFIVRNTKNLIMTIGVSTSHG